MARSLRWKKTAGHVAFAAVAWATAAACGQPSEVHYFHHAAMPPGAIGARQLQRGGPLRGYFQPVLLVAPSGAQVALAGGGEFGEASVRVAAGMLIGQVYRLRVTGIPLREGEEVFPTIEVIDRTYPPPGREAEFPVRVEIAQSDLEAALNGHYVTRVIYLEAPRQALPTARNPRAQEWFDVLPGEDPLQVADTLGRPVAILRMGGRQPADPQSPDAKFLYGSPPWRPLEVVPLPEVLSPREVPVEPPPPAAGEAPENGPPNNQPLGASPRFPRQRDVSASRPMRYPVRRASATLPQTSKPWDRR